MANAAQFIGSKISLISKAEIRYDGILYSIDTKESTISLAKVRSYGTEDRPTERPSPAKDEIYEFIIFRGLDVKNIDVVEPPKMTPSSSEGIPVDPAIVEVSHYNSKVSGRRSPFGRSKRKQSNENILDGLLGRGSRHQRTTDAETQVQRSIRKDEKSVSEQSRQSDDRSRGGRGQGRGGNWRVQNQGFRGRPIFNFYPRGNIWTTRGFRRPQGMLKAPQQAKVTFDNDFDFEKSHEEHMLTKMKDLKVSPLSDGRNEEIKTEDILVKSDEPEEQENKDPTIFYNKNDFFDAISCEALERTKGSMNRPDWRKELKLNAETFGLSGQRRGFFRGGRGGFYPNRGGFDNRWSYNSPRGGYYNNRYNGQGSF